MQRPPGDLWVFAYGSLMWSPSFPHAETRPAVLFGYHRALCIRSDVYRGTPEKPGLVFGLDRGGSCRGLAFRIRDGDAASVMDILWNREMVTRVYQPRWLRARVAGRQRSVWTFVADRTHDQYVGRLSDDETVKLVLQGTGKGGRCLDYLNNTLVHLDGLGIHDARLARIVDKARQAKP